jgi:hypothetical protein
MWARFYEAMDEGLPTRHCCEQRARNEPIVRVRAKISAMRTRGKHMTAPLTKWGALSGKFAAIALTLVLMGSQSHAQGTAATFRSLAGSWSGEGIIRMSSGSTERIRCRAIYTVGAGDPGGVSQQTMLQELLCASDSFKFQIKTRVSRTDKRLTGNWIELSRNVSGNLVGRITNGRVDATVDGGVFSAAISITPNGRRQAVTIRPSSVDVAEVTIALTKSGG